MRIGFAVGAREEYGFGRYLRLLLAGLAKVDSANEYVIFSAGDAAQSIVKRPERSRLVVLPTKRPAFRWRQKVLAPAALKEKIDVLHFHNNTIWSRKPLSTVVTLHHLSYAWPPEEKAVSWIERRYIRALTRRIAKDADVLLTDSHASALDITKLLHVGPPKLRAVHLAGDPEFRAPKIDDVIRFRTLHKLKRPYFFFPGALSARKNVNGMLRAFRRFSQARDASHEFVIAGEAPKAFGYRAADLGELKSSARFLGFVPAGDMPLLYAGATALLYVTHYEGFGFPILEAFACGCPVVTSTTASCPEVAADAAIFADPHDEAAIADAMALLADDAALRETYAAKGRHRLAAFSWERTARETIRAYADAARISQSV